MTGRFIYEFEGVTFSSIYWADIYKAMLNDARHTGQAFTVRPVSADTIHTVSELHQTEAFTESIRI